MLNESVKNHVLDEVEALGYASYELPIPCDEALEKTRIVKVNQKFVAYLGLTEGQVVNKSLETMMTMADEQGVFFKNTFGSQSQ